MVEKAKWDDWVDEDEEDVRLIDFGEAFPHGAERTDLAEPGGLQVPEKIFTGAFDYRVDLWRAGCTVTNRLIYSEASLTLINPADIHDGVWNTTISVPL